MASINGVTIDTKSNSEIESNRNSTSAYSNKQYTNNIHITANALEKYLCNTIQESLDSIDKALAIKDYDITNQKLRIYG